MFNAKIYNSVYMLEHVLHKLMLSVLDLLLLLFLHHLGLQEYPWFPHSSCSSYIWQLSALVMNNKTYLSQLSTGVNNPTQISLSISLTACITSRHQLFFPCFLFRPNFFGSLMQHVWMHQAIYICSTSSLALLWLCLNKRCGTQSISRFK